jgi:hypothetical protein
MADRDPDLAFRRGAARGVAADAAPVNRHPVQLVGQERSYFDVLLGQNGGGNGTCRSRTRKSGVGEVFVTQTSFLHQPVVPRDRHRLQVTFAR